MLFGGAFHKSYLIPVFRGIFFLDDVCEFVLDTVSGSTFFCELFSGDSDESLLSVSHTVYIFVWLSWPTPCMVYTCMLLLLLVEFFLLSMTFSCFLKLLSYIMIVVLRQSNTADRIRKYTVTQIMSDMIAPGCCFSFWLKHRDLTSSVSSVCGSAIR